MPVIRSDHTGNFTQITNTMLRNSVLSLSAKGLLAILLTYMDNWDFHPEILMHDLDIGKTQFYGRLNELIKAGYVHVVDERDDKHRFSHKRYYVLEDPELWRDQSSGDQWPPKRTKPLPEKPDAGIPEPVAPEEDDPDMDYPDNINIYPKQYKPKKDLQRNIFLNNSDRGEVEKDVKERIKYVDLQKSFPAAIVDKVVEVLTETLLDDEGGYINLSGKQQHIPKSHVQRRFERIDYASVEKAIKKFDEIQKMQKIHNENHLLRALLFNNAVGLDDYFAIGF